MATNADWTVADLLDRFGPIPIRRIRQVPAPGTARERDVVEIRDRVPDQPVVLTEDGTITADPVLPGLATPVRTLFVRLGPAPAPMR